MALTTFGADLLVSILKNKIVDFSFICTRKRKQLFSSPHGLQLSRRRYVNSLDAIKSNLTPGFDPYSLKVAKLRDILLENNVEFPATAKKKHLIELFEKNIVSKKTKRKHSRKFKKSETDENASRLAQDPTKTPEKKRRAKRKLKEPKPLTTGNMFDVDSDSESDILSPRKKLKISPKSSPLKDSTRDSSINIDSTESTPQKSVLVNTTQEGTNAESVNDHTNADNSTVVHKPAGIPFSPVGFSDSSSATHEESFSAKVTKSPEPNEVSQSSGIDLFVDTAQSFDKSLTTLRQRRSGEKNPSKDERDVELAKLLGVDLGGVKPKKNGRRVVTPRRPIIIQEKRLSRDYYALSDEEIEVEEKIEREEAPLTKETATKEKIDSDEDILSEDEETGVLETEKDDNMDTTTDEKDSLPRQNRTKLVLVAALRGIAYLAVWVTVLGVTLFGYWYREQTFLVGYCGQEIIKPTIPATPETPKLLVAFGEYLDEEFRPKCVKCPQHARCFPNLEIGCYDDFVEYTPWYFSYVPIVDPTLKKCVSNTKKAEKIEIMIDVALDLLRARNANRNCGNTPADDLEAGVSIQDLHDLLLSIKAPYITEEEFEELWARSVVELEGKPEIIVRQVTI